MFHAWIRVFIGVCLLAMAVVATTESVSKTVIPIPMSFKNSKILRTIDLRTNIVREEVAIRAKNIDSAPVQDYIFVLPEHLQDNVASITAINRDDKTPLVLKGVGFDSEKKHQLYKVTLKEPVQPGEDVLLVIKLALTHLVRPFPPRVPQVARQVLRCDINAYVYSPYFTDEAKTTMRFPNSNFISVEGGDHEMVGDTVVLGPYTSVEPESSKDIQCHYLYTHGLPVLRKMRRDIEVSHWASNLAVEEHFDLYNAGAELDKPFNRLIYMQSQQIHDQTNAIKDITWMLPAGARDVYYRDEIGNVSTSAFRNDLSASVLTIQPRYPVFGSWNYSWYHGYNVDASRFLRTTKGGKHILNIDFVTIDKHMMIDDVQMRIILPEGATNVEVHSPFSIDSIEHKTHFTYFDSIGRHMVVLDKHNVVREHVQPIQIVYEYPSQMLFQKPVVVSAVLFTIFLMSSIISRFSFAIGSSVKSTKQTKSVDRKEK